MKNNFINILYLFFFTLIIIIFFNNKIGAQNILIRVSDENKEYELSGKWYFIANDDLKYKNYNYDIKDWDLLDIDHSWKDVKKYSQYNGIGWYKKIIYNYNNFKNLSLFLPFHFIKTQIFFNNHLIYESNKFNNNENITGKNMCIVIPDSSIKNGKNIISIRTEHLDNHGDFLKFPSIGSYNVIQKKWLYNVIWYYFLLSVNLFLTIFFILIFIKRKAEKYYIHFAIFSLSLGLWIIGKNGHILWILDYQFLHIIFTYFFSPIACLTLIKFLHDFLDISHNFVGKFLITINIFFATFVSFNFIVTRNIDCYQKYFFEPYILGSLIISFYCTFICIKAVRMKHLYAKQILLGVAFFTLSYNYSALTFLKIINAEPIVIEGFWVMTIFFAYVLSTRFANVHTELEKAHQEQKVLDKMKDEFLATTSHELRTPLHGIIGLSQTLLTGRLNIEQKHNVKLIEKSAVHLNHLVSEILDFSKIKNAKVDLYLSQVNLEELISSVLSLLKILIVSKKIKFITDIDNLPEITADKGRIRQVLINLVENAIKFTNKGNILITAKQVNNEIIISVKDNGIGIDKNKIEQIWNPFVQAEDANVRSGKGVGLGLAICKHLIEMHNGHIWVESEKGKGTTFSFSLNIDNRLEGVYKTEEERELSAVDKSLSLKNMQEYNNFFISLNKKKNRKVKATILVVDDDMTNLQIIVNICSPAGYQVRTVKTGNEALSLIKTDKPDLVLLDLMLPHMSGYEVCSKIREFADELTIPVIMLTARNQMEDIIKGFNVGANDYLTKPFDRLELLARIENQLAIKSMYSLEKNLTHTLNIYKYIVSSSGEHMCFIDTDFKFIAVNDAFLRAVDLSNKQIMDKKIDQFKNMNVFWKDLYKYSQNCLKGEEVHVVNWYDFPKSKRVAFEISMYPYIDENKKISGIVMNSRDVSKQIQLENEILNVSEAERKQIGMELHDGLSHTLLGIAIKTKLLSDKKNKSINDIKPEVQVIENEINTAITMTRSLARGLFPVELENQKLTTILHDFKIMLEKSSDIKCNINLSKNPRVTKYNVNNHLYYIIQEAIRNIIKHAKASKVDIKVTYRKGFITIRIYNNGISIPDVSKIPKSRMGLNIMNYRARMIGAYLQNHAVKKGGTEFICKFKCE